jgi:hypothetical protein
MKRHFLVALALVALAFPSFADTFPSRPIKIIVPFGPGGFTDVVARILQKELQPVLGQPIVIENRPGAGSTIGTDAVAKSPPDGYTLAMVSTTHVISPHLYKKMPYDALADFTPVMRLVEGPYVMVVNPSLGVKNVQEFIALARKEPGQIFFASSGNGSSQHLVGALFMQLADVKLTHVPYKGSNAAMQDLLGGRVKASFVGMPNDGGGRGEGLRGDDMARHAGAQGNAARRGRQAQRQRAQGARGPAGAEAHGQGRRGGGALHARAIRRAHENRVRPLGRRGAQDRRGGELKAYSQLAGGGWRRSTMSPPSALFSTKRMFCFTASM